MESTGHSPRDQRSRASADDEVTDGVAPAPYGEGNAAVKMNREADASGRAPHSSVDGVRDKRATILDVAAAAGVSRQTVTRAMNNMPGIKPATRERVQQEARTLGYVPSRFAKGLVQGSRTSVGLSIPGLTNPYFPAFASSVVEAATQRGWHVVVDDYGHGESSGLSSVQHLAPHVDAVIGYLGPHTLNANDLLSGRPLLVLDRVSGEAGAGISFDYPYAASLALDHLALRGSSSVLYLDAIISMTTAADAPAVEIPFHVVPLDDGGGTDAGRSDPAQLSVRGKAFVELAASRGVGLEVVSAGESAEAAFTSLSARLASGPCPDAVLAFNDLMAAGALKALSAHGVRVPQDCVVMGMDGIPLGTLLAPELTTLSLDLRAVGRMAVDLVAGLIDGSLVPGSPESAVTVRHELTVRESA